MSVGFRSESRVQHWREWEVEVVDADLLDSALKVREVAGEGPTPDGASGGDDHPAGAGEGAADGAAPEATPQEPASGTARFLDAVGQVLQDSGARPSAAGSKVEKVVGKTAGKFRNVEEIRSLVLPVAGASVCASSMTNSPPSGQPRIGRRPVQLGTAVSRNPAMTAAR